MFDFVIISLKNHNLATLDNFGSPKSNVMGAEGEEPSVLGNLKKLVSKTMHFRQIPDKIQLKNLKLVHY